MSSACSEHRASIPGQDITFTSTGTPIPVGT